MKKLFTSLKYVMTVAALFLSANVMADEIEWVASAQGYANQQDVLSIDFDDVVSATLDKGSNKNGPKYYNTGSALRLYGGNTMTISCADDYTITSVDFSFASGEGTNAILVDTGDFAGSSWEGSSQSVTFTVDGTTGHRRIASITITYTSEGGGVVTVKRPVISPTSGTYTEPQTVTITAEEGLTIYYSPQVGTTFQVYSAPFVVSSDATVTAYAQDAAGNKSSEVTVEYKIIDLGGLTGSGTATDPYTVADAMALYAGNALPAEKVFVKGKISRIKSLDVTKYTRAQYYISDDGTTTSDELYIYNGNYLNGEAFTANDQIKVGDDVVIYGKLVLFGSTKEMDQNNFIYQLNGEGGGSIEVKTYETIAAAKAAAKDTAVEAILKLNDVVVTYVDGTNYYISDGTDGFLIYGAINGLTEIAAGDVLKGQIKGDLYLYHGLPELVPATTGTEVVKNGTAEVVAEEAELGDILADGLAYSSKLVKLSEVMFLASELTTEGTNKHGQVNFTSMGEEALLFDQFDVAKGLVFDTEAEDYEFSAIVSVRDNVVQFYPVNKEELEREVQLPTYETIAALNRAATADKAKVIFKMEEMLVTYVNGRNVYITDNKLGFLLYASANTTLKAGDKISGEVTGSLWNRNGVPQLEYVTTENEITVVSENNEVTPFAADFASLIDNTNNYLSMLVELNGVMITAEQLDSKNVIIKQGDAELTLRDNFGILTDITFDTANPYSFKAIVAVYVKDDATTIQVYPVVRSEFNTEVYVFDGDGTQENPYSVADVRYLVANEQASADNVWVKGTIVGTVNGSFKEEKFANTEGDENLVASNVVLSDPTPAFEFAKCIPVELKATTVFRSGLNLVDNFGNLGKEILIHGTVMKYFSVAGVKNLDDAIIDGVSLGVHGVAADKKQLSGDIYTLSGQKTSTMTQRGLYIVGGKKVLVK